MPNEIDIIQLTYRDGTPFYPLTPNQTITLSGVVTGSGSSTIVTSIGQGAIPNTMLAGGIANNKLANSSLTVGNATISLGGSATLTQIGVPAWAQASSLAFSSLPAMYIGSTAVKSNNTAAGIIGITSINATSSTNHASRIVWDSTNNAWHFYGNIYADGYVSAGGRSETSGGGGGSDVNVARTWQSINTGDETQALGSNLGKELHDTLQTVTSTYATQTWVTSQINTAITSAIKYKGTTTTALSDGSTTNPITINGSSYTAQSGDVVLYGGKEYLWDGSKWEQLGDEESWALKTVTISAGTGLTGGGDLTANRTISLSSATIASLALADTAVQPAALNNYQPKDADLTAIAGLTGTSGFLKKTAANTWALDTTTYASKLYADEGGVETIIGTQTASTNAFTGVSRLATANDFVSGYKFVYWLPYAGTSTAATLTLTFQDGTTKSMNLYYSGSTRLTTHLAAGAQNVFTYLENANVAGTAYTGAWMARGYYSDSYDRNLSNYENRFIHSTATPLYRYKLCGYDKDGKIVPLVITNQTDGTIVDKTPVSVGIDPTKGVVYYSSTTNITAVSTTFRSLYNEFPLSTCAYTFNDTVPVYKDVYLKGTIGNDGMFYLDTTTHKSWYVFAPNRASDGVHDSVFVAGCYYMFVGPTYSSNNYLQLKYDNPVYYFDGTQLIPYNPDFGSDSFDQVDEFLYADVHTDKKNAKVKEVNGRALAWNQLIKTFDNAEIKPSAIAAFSYDGNCATSDSWNAYNPFRFNIGLSSKAGHYFYVNVNYSTDSTVSLRLQFAGQEIPKALTTGITKTIFQATAPSGTYIDYFSVYASVTQTNVILKDLFVIDLTQMFGAGNEPNTVEEFEMLFPLPYYSYNPGELVSLTASGIKTIGRNLWDEEWIATSSTIENKNPISVKPNTKYYIYSKFTNGFIIREVSSSGVVTTPTGYGQSSREFITSSDTVYLLFSTFGTENITAYTPDTLPICISLSDPSFNGQYEPYKESTAALNITSITGKLNGTGNSVVIFPDGMKSAGNVHDEIKGNKAIKRVGRVDFDGSQDENWSLQSINSNGIANFCTLIISYPSGTRNAVCDKFIYDETLIANATSPGFLLASTNSTYIRVFSTTASTVAEFRTYLATNNVSLYYELATPLEYTLDEEFNASFTVERGGMMTVLPENTSTTINTAPLPCVIQYGVPQDDICTLSTDQTIIGKKVFSNLTTIAGGLVLGTSANAKAAKLEWDETNNAWKLTGNFYATGWVSAGGVSSTSGGGGGSDVTVLRSWPANPSDQYEALGSNLGQGLKNSVDGLDTRVTRLEQSATSVTITNTLAPGTRIATISIDGTPTDINAPIPDMSAYVPKTTTVNGYALSSNVVIDKSDLGLGNVENIAINSWSGSALITTVGTIGAGVWHGSQIENTYLSTPWIEIGNTRVSLGATTTLTALGIPTWAQENNAATLIANLSGYYHPLHGDTLLYFEASTITAGSALTVGNANPSGAKIFFGSMNDYIELVNIAASGQTPSYALHSTLPIYSDGFISAGGRSDTTEGSGGGGGGVPHVLLSESQYDALVDAGTVDAATIYLVYEDES